MDSNTLIMWLTLFTSLNSLVFALHCVKRCRFPPCDIETYAIRPSDHADVENSISAAPPVGPTMQRARPHAILV